MRGLSQYLGWEIVAIHAMTGALFALINVLIVRALVPEQWGLALGLAPLFVWSWWGFWAEARYMLRVSRELRHPLRTR